MVHAKTRAAILQSFEEGVIDTPQGAFIGSFSIATLQLLLSAIASDVVPVSRRNEVDVRFVLAEADELLPESELRNLLPFRKPSGVLCVIEWRTPGLPLLFTPASSWQSGTSLRTGEAPTLPAFVSGYRHCDPTQVRIRNGVVYQKTYRGWRPIRDLQRSRVPLDRLLLLASVLGVEVECSLSWSLSRWLEARLVHRTGPGSRKGGDRRSHIAA